MPAESLVSDITVPAEERAVLHLEDHLAQDTARQLRDVVGLLSIDGITTFVLDFSEVQLVDAAGARTLLDLGWLVFGHGGRVQPVALDCATLCELDDLPSAAGGHTGDITGV